MLMAACSSSAPLVPPGITDVTGLWEGTWNGAAVGRGRITLDLKQVGTKVTGSLAMVGATAISATDGPVEGFISGTTLSFNQPDGAMEGEMVVVEEQMTGQATGRLKAGLSLQRQPKQP
jgi:hypothetical protein